MRAFVSYTSKDPAVTRGKLERVEARLKPFCTVFIDLLHNENGKQCRVDRELRCCDVVLQLTSPKYQSEWVQKELITARRKNKPVVKVGIDELLTMDDEQLYLMLTDVDKKSCSVWSILIVSLLICLGISVLGIWLSYFYVDKHSVGGDVMNARGVFGDSWGGVNAIISAFAFAGVIVTLFLQNRDLNLQRKEMARQREEFEKENETLKQQRFESALYNMLQLQQQIVNDLAYDTTVEGYNDTTARSRIPIVVKGRDIFRFAYEQLKHYYKSPLDGERRTTEGMKGILMHLGLAYYKDFTTPSYFDHYFRHLYRILKFIDSNESLTFEEKYKYVGDVRGTLSRYELVWIYYNLLSNEKFEPFKTIAEDYSLLKNLSEDFLALSKESEDIVKQKGKYYFAAEGFSGTDYEFFITDVKGDNRKFYVGAFYNKDEIDEGMEMVKRYKKVIGG